MEGCEEHVFTLCDCRNQKQLIGVYPQLFIDQRQFLEEEWERHAYGLKVDSKRSCSTELTSVAEKEK